MEKNIDRIHDIELVVPGKVRHGRLEVRCSGRHWDRAQSSGTRIECDDGVTTQGNSLREEPSATTGVQYFQRG